LKFLQSYTVNEKLSYTAYLSIVRSQIAGLGLDTGAHNLRKGGATDLATQVTESKLLLSGRWRDPRLLESYVKVSDDQRFALSEKLFFSYDMGGLATNMTWCNSSLDAAMFGFLKSIFVSMASGLLCHQRENSHIILILVNLCINSYIV
jgi:hypothetical protein